VFAEAFASLWKGIVLSGESLLRWAKPSGLGGGPVAHIARNLAGREELEILMRRLGVLLAGLAVLAAPSPASAKTHGRPWICRPGHAHLVEADKQAQVYETGHRYEGVFEAERIVGCVYGSSRQFFVGDTPSGSGSGGGGSSVEQMSGSLVAVGGSSYSTVYESESDWVSVIDLRTGRRIHESFTGPPEPARNTGYEDYGAGPLASLVLRPNGDLAWIAATPPSRLTSAGRYQVYTLEASGRRMIAFGNDIEPSSLALAGETIYWTQGGKPFSAPLR
jgi:hypothetical protein